MSDDRPEDPESRRAQQAEDEARRLQLLTGMSADAARAWLAYCSGRAGGSAHRPGGTGPVPQ